MSSNKKLGSDFEDEVVELMAQGGYWAHRIVPDARGAQPFDVIAVKNDMAVAIECKTLAETEKYFPISRLEDNQKFAFEYWCKRGNRGAFVAVKWKDTIKFIPWQELRQKRKVRME